MTTADEPAQAAHLARVFAAADLFVTAGANLGDGMAEPEDLSAGDIYELDPEAQPLRLALAQPRAGAPRARQHRAPHRCRHAAPMAHPRRRPDARRR